MYEAQKPNQLQDYPFNSSEEGANTISNDSANSPQEVKKKLSLNVNAKSFQAQLPSTNNNSQQLATTQQFMNLNNATNSNSDFQQEEIIEHLEIDTFKTQQCTLNVFHNPKLCTFYHNLKDKRRQQNYFSEICVFIERPNLLQEYNGQYTQDQLLNIQKCGCPYGDSCTKAHNRVEVLYHKDKYKKRFCSFYPNNISNCDYGKFCSFAHSELDLKMQLIHYYVRDTDFYIFHFKTEMCPFNFTEHDKSFCVYAHN